MQAVRYKPDQDYPTVKAWWQIHGWTPMPPESLPAVGLMVAQGEHKLVAGWLYNTDTNIAWIEMIISNPLCDKIERDKALNLLIDGLISEAKQLKKSIIFTSCQHPGLIERYKAHGAVVGDTGMTNLIWRIG